METLIESLIWHDAVIQLIEIDEARKSLKMLVSFTNYEQPFSGTCSEDVVLASILFDGIDISNPSEILTLSGKKSGSWEAEVLSSGFSKNDKTHVLSLFVKVEYDEGKDDYLTLDLYYKQGVVSLE